MVGPPLRRDRAMSSEIRITLDDATSAALRTQGYVLYVLQAFETSTAQGQALVWFELPNPEGVVRISFLPPEQAYIGMSVADVKLGDIVTLGEDDNITSSTGGNPRGVTFRNTTKDPQTAGLAIGGPEPIPVSAVPLDGLSEDIIEPLNMLLLTFSTAGVKPGGTLRQSEMQSLLYKLSVPTAEVTFDINAGWSFGAAPWFRTVGAGVDLSTVLAKQRPLVEA